MKMTKKRKCNRRKHRKSLPRNRQWPMMTGMKWLTREEETRRMNLRE
jgi:hypothetical protein